jgi:L-alanine-DL-glutamate epimerase-like enolase superfamily enzyme
MTHGLRTSTPAVERLDVSAYRIPLAAPESDGTLTWDHTDVVVVEPVAGGRRGLGFSYGSRAAATFVRDVLAPVVVDCDALDPPAAWAAMVRSVRNHGRPGVASVAIAAVDIALWDLKARIHDRPLCRVLGRARDEVPIYGSGGFTSLTDDQFRRQLERWVDDQGIPRVKMKIGEAWGTQPRRDLDRVAFARKVIGDGTALFVDANGAYTAKQARQIERELRSDGVKWFEEPVSSDDLEGLRTIRSASDIEIAAGEYGYDLPYFERMCAAGAVDCLQADVSRCAGITEWLRVAAVAAAHQLELSGHCAPSLHVHPAAAIANLRHVEYFADHVRADHALFDGVLEPQTGGVLVPDLTRAGLGLDLKPADAERYRVDL